MKPIFQFQVITFSADCLPDLCTPDTSQHSQQEAKSCRQSEEYTKQLKTILSLKTLLILFSAIGHLWWTFCECTPGIAWGDRTFAPALGPVMVRLTREQRMEWTRGLLCPSPHLYHCALAFISTFIKHFCNFLKNVQKWRIFSELDTDCGLLSDSEGDNENGLDALKWGHYYVVTILYIWQFNEVQKSI